MSKDIIYREDAIGAINGWLKQNHFPAFGDGILYLVPSADRLREKMISIDTLKEILSDIKEAHRNNSEAEAVIADIWDEVVDALKE